MVTNGLVVFQTLPASMVEWARWEFAPALYFSCFLPSRESTFHKECQFLGLNPEQTCHRQSTSACLIVSSAAPHTWQLDLYGTCVKFGVQVKIHQWLTPFEVHIQFASMFLVMLLVFRVQYSSNRYADFIELEYLPCFSIDHAQKSLKIHHGLLLIPLAARYAITRFHSLPFSSLAVNSE